MSFERTITYKGKTLRVIEWSKLVKIDYKILIARLNLGWSVQKALTKPTRVWDKSKKNIIPENRKKDPQGHQAVFIDTEGGDYGKF